MARMNANYPGDLDDFQLAYNYFDGSYRLINVMWFADGVGLNDCPSYYRTRLNNVATGNYIDIMIDNY